MGAEQTQVVRSNSLQLSDYRKYYTTPVIFEMVKVARGRELAFLGHDMAGSMRYIKAHTVSFFKSFLNYIKFFERPRGIYYSLSHYEGFPVTSFIPPVRDKQKLDFVKNYKNYFRGLDLALDFDVSCTYFKKNHCALHNHDVLKQECSRCPNYTDNWSIVYQEVVTVKELFDTWSLPYQLKCSGSGFHINIEWKYMKECIPIIQRLRRVKSLAEEDEIALFRWFLCELSEINNLTSLDTSIVDFRRPWKMPYSIDIKTGNVALPLSNKQFENFHWDMLKPAHVLPTILNRGLLERSGSAENIINFIENFLLG